MPLRGTAQADRLRLIFSFAFTVATLWLILGTAWQVVSWIRTPLQFPITLAPVPRSNVGVVLRLMLEVLLFRSLARASLATWIPAMAFHYGLLLVLLVHLRFFMPILPVWFVPLLMISGIATLLLLGGLGVLLLRRIVVDRVRYVSAPSDYLHLLLLMAIALSGTVMKRIWPVNLQGVGEFVRGVGTLDWQPLPDGSALVVHLLLVIILLLVFPVSKLIHGVGVFAAPTFLGKDPSSRKR